MPSVPYNALDRYLPDKDQAVQKDTFFPVYLIYGDEFLCKNTLSSLVSHLIPAESRSLNYETVDGLRESIRDVLEKVNTYAFFSGRKAVCYADARFFKSSTKVDPLIDKIKTAWEAGELSLAGKYFVRLLSALTISYDDLAAPDSDNLLKRSAKGLKGEKWPGEMLHYCRENNLAIPEPEDDARALMQSLERGFPRNNHLILITAGSVDKRRSIYKAIEKAGLIIDCTVPLGDRAADKKVQQVVLKQRMMQVLSRHAKTMEPQAFQALYEKTGFALRTFSGNLEKLIQYTGSRNRITRADVETVLVRTNKDPIYVFTQAIVDRNMPKALFYLNSLLSDDFHALQMLASITRQIRKLLVANDFIVSDANRTWYAGCQFNHFKTHVLPAVKKFDEDLKARISRWERLLKGEKELMASASGKRKPRESTPKTDLTLAENPNNPYPIYQTLRKSDGFSRDHLISILAEISKTDRRLKSTDRDPKSVLETLIFKICRHVDDIPGE